MLTVPPSLASLPALLSSAPAQPPSGRWDEASGLISAACSLSRSQPQPTQASAGQKPRRKCLFMPVMPKAKQFVVCDPNFLPFFFFQNITKPKTTPSLPPPSPQAARTDLFTLAAMHPHWPLLWLCPHPGYWEPPGRDCRPGEIVGKLKEPEEALSPLGQQKDGSGD